MIRNQRICFEMTKRCYYPNRKIIDDRLPFEIQITTGLKVYYSYDGQTQLYRADSIFHKRIKWLDIFIRDYNIIVKGFDKNNNLIYTIKHKGVEI